MSLQRSVKQKKNQFLSHISGTWCLELRMPAHPHCFRSNQSDARALHALYQEIHHRQFAAQLCRQEIPLRVLVINPLIISCVTCVVATNSSRIRGILQRKGKKQRMRRFAAVCAQCTSVVKHTYSAIHLPSSSASPTLPPPSPFFYSHSGKPDLLRQEGKNGKILATLPCLKPVLLFIKALRRFKCMFWWLTMNALSCILKVGADWHITIGDSHWL